MKHAFSQLLSNSRPHFNLGAAVLASALAHYGFIHYSNLTTQHTGTHNQPSNLSVHLAAEQSKIKVAKEIISPQNNALQNTSNVVTNIPPGTAKSETISPHYFSPKEVEIQALPVVNVDLSMLSIHKNTAELQQSLPIQLRLYIDEFGRVANIERIAIVLPQDDEMATQLEALLKEVQFTPAKRQFADVKSYQDVAFDFKANH